MNCFKPIYLFNDSTTQPLNYLIHLDRVGSPIMITDIGDNVVRDRKYVAFGNVVANTGTLVESEKPFIIMALIYSIFFFSVGVLILLFPYKTQNLAIQILSKYNQSRYFDISSYVDWAKSRSYVIFVRILGFLFVCMTSLVFYFLIKKIQS